MPRLRVLKRGNRYWLKARFWPPMSVRHPGESWIDALVDTGSIRSALPQRALNRRVRSDTPYLDLMPIVVETATGDRHEVPRTFALVEITDGQRTWTASIESNYRSGGLLVLPKSYAVIGTDIISQGRLILADRERELWLELPAI